MRNQANAHPAEAQKQSHTGIWIFNPTTMMRKHGGAAFTRCNWQGTCG